MELPPIGVEMAVRLSQGGRLRMVRQPLQRMLYSQPIFHPEARLSPSDSTSPPKGREARPEKV